MKNHYRTLGLYPDEHGSYKFISKKRIRKAYYQLAQKKHSDVGGVDEEMQELNEAYEILSNEGKRREYDWQLENHSECFTDSEKHLYFLHDEETQKQQNSSPSSCRTLALYSKRHQNPKRGVDLTQIFNDINCSDEELLISASENLKLGLAYLCNPSIIARLQKVNQYKLFLIIFDLYKKQRLDLNSLFGNERVNKFLKKLTLDDEAIHFIAACNKNEKLALQLLHSNYGNFILQNLSIDSMFSFARGFYDPIVLFLLDNHAKELKINHIAAISVKHPEKIEEISSIFLKNCTETMKRQYKLYLEFYNNGVTPDNIVSLVKKFGLDLLDFKRPGKEEQLPTIGHQFIILHTILVTHQVSDYDKTRLIVNLVWYTKTALWFKLDVGEEIKEVINYLLKNANYEYFIQLLKSIEFSKVKIKNFVDFIIPFIFVPNLQNSYLLEALTKKDPRALEFLENNIEVVEFLLSASNPRTIYQDRHITILIGYAIQHNICMPQEFVKLLSNDDKQRMKNHKILNEYLDGSKNITLCVFNEFVNFFGFIPSMLRFTTQDHEVRFKIIKYYLENYSENEQLAFDEKVKLKIHIEDLFIMTSSRQQLQQIFSLLQNKKHKKLVDTILNIFVSEVLGHGKYSIFYQNILHSFYVLLNDNKTLFNHFFNAQILQESFFNLNNDEELAHKFLTSGMLEKLTLPFDIIHKDLWNLYEKELIKFERYSEINNFIKDKAALVESAESLEKFKKFYQESIGYLKRNLDAHFTKCKIYYYDNIINSSLIDSKITSRRKFIELLNYICEPNSAVDVNDDKLQQLYNFLIIAGFDKEILELFNKKIKCLPTVFAAALLTRMLRRNEDFYLKTEYRENLKEMLFALNCQERLEYIFLSEAEYYLRDRREKVKGDILLHIYLTFGERILPIIKELGLSIILNDAKGLKQQFKKMKQYKGAFIDQYGDCEDRIENFKKQLTELVRDDDNTLEQLMKYTSTKMLVKKLQNIAEVSSDNSVVKALLYARNSIVDSNNLLEWLLCAAISGNDFIWEQIVWLLEKKGLLGNPETRLLSFKHFKFKANSAYCNKFFIIISNNAFLLHQLLQQYDLFALSFVKWSLNQKNQKIIIEIIDNVARKPEFIQRVFLELFKKRELLSNPETRLLSFKHFQANSDCFNKFFNIISYDLLAQNFIAWSLNQKNQKIIIEVIDNVARKPKLLQCVLPLIINYGDMTILCGLLLDKMRKYSCGLEHLTSLTIGIYYEILSRILAQSPSNIMEIIELMGGTEIPGGLFANDTNCSKILAVVFNTIDLEINRLQKNVNYSSRFWSSSKSKIEQLMEARETILTNIANIITNYSDKNDEQKNLLEKIKSELVSQLSKYVTCKVIANKRNRIGAFFKVLLGVILGMLGWTIPFWFKNFRLSFFYSTSQKNFYKLLNEVQNTTIICST